MAENIDIFDFELNDQDMTGITGLDGPQPVRSHRHRRAAREADSLTQQPVRPAAATSADGPARPGISPMGGH